MKKKTSRIVGLALVALVGGMVAAPIVMAEPPPAGGPGGPGGKGGEFRQHRKGMFKAKRAEFLRKELGLDEARATSIETAMDGYRKQRRTIRDQQRTLMGKLQALLDANSNDAKAYASNLKAIKANRDKLDKLRETEKDFLSKQLTPKQQAIMLMKFRGMKGRHGGRGRHHGGPRGGR